MIILELADALPQIIGRAILTVAAYSGLGAALLVLAIALITSAITGNVPTLGRRPADEPTTKYEEAA